METNSYTGNLSIFCSVKGNVTLPITKDVTAFAFSDEADKAIRSIIAERGAKPETVAKTGGKRINLGWVTVKWVQQGIIDGSDGHPDTIEAYIESVTMAKAPLADLFG